MPGRPSATRRTVLRGAALTPVAGTAAAACSPLGGTTEAATPTAPVELGSASELSPGDARLYRDHNVVVSRAGDGALSAYSSVCTHAGCAINKLDGEKLICPCHGSEFDAATGEVLRGPASVGLPKLSVKAENGKLIAGPGA
ncbi:MULTISPECIES: Rieske 2Fe-2S domain-containing protein [unclassified Streptomyces]|uniref:Rieske (2Fe-2S) protein n=1 Tax=unclassified Streptomyces TaxID=2593676 RepID=UPI003D724BC9